MNVIQGYMWPEKLKLNQIHNWLPTIICFNMRDILKTIPDS